MLPLAPIAPAAIVVATLVQDMFADIFRGQLAKRLLNERSASDDAERGIISKLKLRCGAQYTAKMEGMIRDLSISLEQKRLVRPLRLHCSVPSSAA